jgi:hypothetical protein
VKNAAGMYGMKRDMSGSAAALGALLALTRLQFERPVECWLAVSADCCECGVYVSLCARLRPRAEQQRKQTATVQHIPFVI